MTAEAIADVQANCTVFFSVAASVDFNEPMEDALQINTLGAMRITNLARGARKVDVVCHVSTCYVNSNLPSETKVGEKIYESGDDDEQEVQRLLAMPVSELTRRTKEILGRYPNTYTYTKALGERILMRHSEGLPVVIFRPSVIIAAVKEPAPGWIDSLAASGAFIQSFAMGIIKYTYVNSKMVLDIIPVDYCNNALLVLSAARAGKNGLFVTNYGSSDVNPCSIKTIIDQAVAFANRQPF